MRHRQKRSATPCSAASWVCALRSEDADGTDLVYPAAKEELASAPAFERGAWPGIADDATLRERLDRLQGGTAAPAPAQRTQRP
jgi:hypothetical protein